MKWIVGLSLVALLSFAVPVHAAGNATFALSPTSQSVEAGSTFILTLSVNPNGESLDTVRAYLSFPSELVRIDDIQLTGELERTSPGNSIDNERGEVSFGGFSLDGAVTKRGAFAELTLTALKEGIATIAISDASRLIAAGEEKANASGHTDATVTIGKASEAEATEEEVISETEEGNVVQSVSGELVLESSTHPDPDAWSKSDKVEFSWSLTQGSADYYRLAFDKEPETSPTERVITTTASYDNVDEGVWYVHLQAALEDGSSTSTIHRRVAIDKTAPNLIEPSTDGRRFEEGDSPNVYFGTTDDLSGIDHYEISINNGTWNEAASPYVLENISVGDYFIEVKAVDRAGNERFGKTDIRAYPKGTLGRDEEGLEQGMNAKTLALLISAALGIVIFFAIIFSIIKRKQAK